MLLMHQNLLISIGEYILIISSKLASCKLVSILLVLPILIIGLFIWQAPITYTEHIFYPSPPSSFTTYDDYGGIIETPFIKHDYSLRIKAVFSEQNLHTLATNSVLILSLLILFTSVIGLLLNHSIQNNEQLKTSKQLYQNFYLATLLFPILLISLAVSSIFLVANLLALVTLKYLGMIFTITILVLATIIAVGLTWKIIKSCFVEETEETLNLIGINLTKQDAPELWQFVQDIANRGQLKMPDHIVIGMNYCFFVTESPISFWGGNKLSAGATLYIPIPYMRYMDKSEVAAIIGHELAHFTFDDIKYTQRFFAFSKRLIRNTTVLNLQSPTQNTSLWDWIYSILTYPTVVFAECLLDTYHRTVQQWKRSREANADKVGAAATSTYQMAEAMLRVAIITPAIEYIIEEFWFSGGEQRLDVLTSIQQLIERHSLPDPLMQLHSIQSHPLDNHPKLQKRLELLNIKLTDAMLERASEIEHSDLLEQLKLINKAPTKQG